MDNDYSDALTQWRINERLRAMSGPTTLGEAIRQREEARGAASALTEEEKRKLGFVKHRFPNGDNA